MCSFLLLLLTACASVPVVKTEYVRVHPPVSLMVACPVPELNLSTYGAIVEEDVPTLITSLRVCDARMGLLRKWVASVQGTK